MLTFATALFVFATPLFVEKTAQLGTQECGAGSDAGCYTNYVVIADLDGDQKLDVVFPNAKGYYTQATPAEPLVILKNDGAANFTDVSATAVGGFTGWLRQVALGDIDGDGDLDIAAPDAWGGNAALFVNDGSANFTDEAATRWNVTTRAGSVRFADVDDDGDLDLFVGDWGSNPNPSNPSASSVHLSLNDGSGNFTAADDRLPATAFSDGSATPIDLDVIDVNGDFRPDLLINARNGNLQLWINDRTGHFVDASATFPPKTGPYSYGPTACDVDGDGDLDVWVDNGHQVAWPQLLINDGSGTFTDETTARVPASVQGQDDNGVICADLDDDGDFDAVVLSLGDGSDATASERMLINDGTGNFSLSPDAFPLVGDSTLGMDIADLDGDGKLDAVTGQGEQPGWTNRLYLGTNGAPVDARAPLFRAVEMAPTATVGSAETPVIHFAVQDAVTTDTGPRLSDVHVEWTGAGAPQNVAVRFMGGDLFRAVLPARGSGGTASWKACATDPMGNSACSTAVSYEASGSGNPGGGGGGKKGCSCRLDPSADAASSARGVAASLALLLMFGWPAVFRARRASPAPR